MIPTLHTKRLTLRPPKPADEAVMVDFYVNNDITVGGYRRRSADDAKARLRKYMDDWAKGHGIWMLETADGDVVGGAGLAWDDDFPSHELTWFLLPRHRGNGFAAEASRAAIAWGYDVLGWDPIETYMRDENAPARALAARLGGRVSRREVFPDGVTRDIFALPHPLTPQPIFPDRLTTARLLLRRPQASDLTAYIAYGMGEERTEFIGGPSSAEDACKNFYALIGHWGAHGFGRYVFCRRDTGQPIGHVGPLRSSNHHPAEMTWTIWDSSDEGHGYAQEAAKAVRDMWLSTEGAPAMIAVVDPANDRSNKLAKRLGGRIDPNAPPPYWSDKAVTWRFDRGSA